MLTKTDLKAIENVIDNRLDVKLDQKLGPIHSDIKTIKKDVRKLKKDVGGVINMADRGLIRLEKRVEVIETHLNMPEPQTI